MAARCGWGRHAARGEGNTMSKQIIIYNEERDECRNAQVDESTFVISEQSDGTFRTMTYAEWETLRCQQANEAAKARVAQMDVDDAKKEQLYGFLDSFTEGMGVKYLQGARSWGQIYSELVDDFEALL